MLLILILPYPYLLIVIVFDVEDVPLYVFNNACPSSSTVSATSYDPSKISIVTYVVFPEASVKITVSAISF